MLKKRVLFVAEAVTLAHVGRMFALASMVDREKYTPQLAWHPRYNHLLGDIEHEFYPLESITTEQFLQRLHDAKPVYDYRTMEVYVVWEREVFREARPDIVVGDFRLSLATSAQITGLPYINIVNAHWSPYARPRFVVPDSPPVRIFGPFLGQKIFDVARPFFFRAYASDFNRLAEKFGRRSFGSNLRKIYCEGDRTLYPDLPEITPTFDLPATHRYLGPVPWSPDLPAPPFLSELPDDRPIVYLNLGTSGDSGLLPRILDVLGGKPLRVIAATGGKGELQSPSPDIQLVDFIPGDAACERADLMIFNGGVGGTQQAVAAGIPVIGIPSNLDQFLNMDYVQKAGLGTMVRSDRASAAKLSEAIEEVLGDDRYRRRARELRDRACTYRPGEILNQVLDDLLDWRPASPVHRDREPGPPPVTRSSAASPELVEEIVRAAILAPSAANCQPWRYEWRGDTLEIRIIPERANPLLYFLNLDPWVSLGAVLTNMREAAGARGHRIEYEVFPEDARHGVVARVWPMPGAPESGSMVEYLEERCTNRRTYELREVPREVREKLLQAGSRGTPDVAIHWIDDPHQRDRVADASAVFYQLMFENPSILVSMAEWIRWTDRSVEDTKTGLSIPSLEVEGLSRLLFRVVSAPSRARLLAPTGVFRTQRRANARRLRQSSAFVVFTAPEHRAPAVVRAGEAFQRMWLEATRQRLAVQPLAGLMYMATSCRYAGGAGLTPKQQRISEDALAAVGEVVPAFAERVPVIMVRIGYAEAPTARSLRLPLEAVFETVDPKPHGTIERE